MPSPDPYFLVGISQNADLDQDDQEDEQGGKDKQEGQRYRKIVHNLTSRD